MTRTQSRTNAMTILYQINLYKKNNIDYNLEELLKESNSDDFVKELVTQVSERQEELDKTANTYLNNWTIQRLGLTDAAIIRIAIYELLYTNTPPKVCIDEAIELAKSYSDDKVVGMINSVLDKVYHSKQTETK